MIAMATTALILTGCSIIHEETAPPSTTRMAAQQVPDVELDDGPTAAPDAAAAIEQNQPKPSQVWIRDAHWKNGAYDLTVAAPKGGTFEISDGFSTDGDEPPTAECTVGNTSPLTARIAHALPAVTTEARLTCPATARATTPILAVSWPQDSTMNSSQAVFAEGGLSAQGSPDGTDGSVNSFTVMDPADVDVTRVVAHGTQATVMLWSPAGPRFFLEPTAALSGQAEASHPSMACTSQRSAQYRPSPHGRQYRYTLSCTQVKNIKALSLSVQTVHGDVGKTPAYEDTQIELPAPTAR